MSEPQRLPMIDTAVGAFKDVFKHWKKLVLPMVIFIVGFVAAMVFAFVSIDINPIAGGSVSFLGAGLSMVLYAVAVYVAAILACRRLASTYGSERPDMLPQPLNWVKATGLWLFYSVLIMLLIAVFAGVGVLSWIGYNTLSSGGSISTLAAISASFWAAIMIVYGYFFIPLFVQISLGRFQGLRHAWQTAKGHRMRSLGAVLIMQIIFFVLMMILIVVATILALFLPETLGSIIVGILQMLMSLSTMWVAYALFVRITAHMQANDRSNISHPKRDKVMAVWHALVVAGALYGVVSLVQGTAQLPDFSGWMADIEAMEEMGGDAYMMEEGTQSDYENQYESQLPDMSPETETSTEEYPWMQEESSQSFEMTPEEGSYLGGSDAAPMMEEESPVDNGEMPAHQ